MENNKFQLTTSYKGISKLYFLKLLNEIIKIGNLEQEDITSLDFGCGYGFLKKKLKSKNNNINIINYDIEKELSEIRNWKDCKFDILVANQVFYCCDANYLRKLMRELKLRNSELIIVAGISRQSLFNNIGKFLLGYADAHSGTKLRPKEELKILLEFCEIVATKSVWSLADIYKLKFK